MKFLVLAFSLFIQASARSAELSPILADYFQVKDALVSGDANAASAAASQLLKAVDEFDVKSATLASHKAFTDLKDKLAFDARHISESKDINHQREHFESLSANLIKLTNVINLSPKPIYEDYCPMRKAFWLTSDSSIRNPYFGSTMPTCGKVAATIQPK